jgi:NitT/TauT family transport system ATP-binding protein
MTNRIELLNVSKTFPATRNGHAVVVFKDLSLTIATNAPGEENESGYFVVLLGPSGCGKSTILSLIAGLTLPDRGEVWVCDERVKGPHRHSATVPQAYTCFPWLTAVKNVEFGLRLQGKPKVERKRIAADYLGKVDLAAFAHAYPGQLSGGMKQRVAIARTLAMKRPIVLMDEPFGALDAQTRSDMQQILLQLWETEKNTIIFVTHDITEALLLADRIVVFSSSGSILDEKRITAPRPRNLSAPELVQLAEDLREDLQKRPRGERRREEKEKAPEGEV